MKPSFTLPHGVYPTMITPFKNGRIDYGAAAALVDWYAEKGCRGVFAVCQSSEMVYLSLEERTKLAKTVADAAKGRLCVVASGHISDSADEQIREANAIAATGVDAFVAVSNRFDPHNDGDDEFLRRADAFLEGIDPAVPLGIYECPIPYKRLLTPRILDYGMKTGRFVFIKDTCCDPVLLTERLTQLKGSGFELFNANDQTLLHSLRAGAAGYSGVMGNFVPELLAWLCDHFESDPEKAERLSAQLSMLACSHSPAYPCTAKRFLQKFEGLPIGIESRCTDPKALTPYWSMIVDQMNESRKILHDLLGI